MPAVLSHNERAAATWGSGGRDYDRISESVSDALAHLVNRIAPQLGERFLDVATGTGLTARLLASRGAKVNGVDFGAGVIEAAKALAPDIDLRVADAEALPFEDTSFDAVTSTFGVMFVADRKARRARWPVFASGADASPVAMTRSEPQWQLPVRSIHLLPSWFGRILTNSVGCRRAVTSRRAVAEWIRKARLTRTA